MSCRQKLSFARNPTYSGRRVGMRIAFFWALASMLVAPASLSSAKDPWNGDRATCGSASALEQNTAAWVTMCYDDLPRPAPSYVPQLDPAKMKLPGAIMASIKD